MANGQSHFFGFDGAGAGYEGELLAPHRDAAHVHHRGHHHYGDDFRRGAYAP